MRFLLAALLLAACSSEPPATPAPDGKAPAAATPAAPAGDAHATATPAAPSGEAATAFACCADPGVSVVLDGYLKVQKALAADDDAGAKAALAELATAANTNAGTAPGAAGPLLTQVAEASKAAADAADMKARREAFKKVSAPMIQLAKAQTGGEKKVAVAFCPMANASWLQQGGTIANPYYGSEMLTCGSFQ